MSARSVARRAIRAAAMWVCAIVVVGAGAWWWGRGVAPLDDVERDLRTVLLSEAPERSIEPRLVGGVGYAPFTPLVRRGREAAVPTLSGRRLNAGVISAMSRIEAAAHGRRSGRSLAALGAVLLLNGDTEGSIAALERARDLDPGQAPWRANLAAAYLVRHRQSGYPLHAVQALDSAQAALRLEPFLADAKFNLALAFEATGLQEAATAAWRRYVVADGASGWGAEARRHIEAAGVDRTQWAALRARLMTVADPLDVSTIQTAVVHFAQATRELVEDELLTAWARARLTGDRTAAGQAFVRAAAIARAARHAGGDVLLDTVIGEIAAAARPGGAGAQVPAARERRIAEGLLAHAQARQLLTRTEFRAAATAFEDVSRRLAAADCSFWVWSTAQAAYAHYQMRALDLARAQCGRIERFARRHGYRAVLARALWIIALSQRNTGEPEAAFKRSDEAIRLFVDIHEHTQAGSVSGTAADLARRMGDRQESWRLLATGLQATAVDLTSLRRYLVFYNAALFAQREGLLDAALAFQNQAVAASLEVRETGAPAQAYIQRGMLQAAAGRTAEAGADLTAGRAELDRFHGGTRPYLAAEMRILEAALVIEKQPARARTLLQEAAATIEPLSPGRVPELRLALGRAARQLGDTVLASKELERGINYLEGQRVRIVDESLRIALFGTAQALYTERLDLALQTGDATAAFDFSERGRARALLDTTGPGGAAALHSAAVDDVRRWLPSATAFIEYVTLTDRVVAWIITRDVVVRRESVCTSARLAEAARALRRDHGGGERAAFAGTPSQEEAARTLHDVLIRPLEPQLAGVSHLIISPDTVLHDIPFAALQDRRTGRWLVMDFDIQLSPSASWLLTTAGSSPAASAPAPLKFLSVGDPQFDARAYDQLPRLPDAGREAEAVSALFPGGETLTGRGATRSALIRRLPTVDVFHFAGHAVANADAPEMSYLLLAPDHEGDDGRLRATDLRGQRLSRLQLVVLAGCRTAGGAATFGEGGLHLARSFLAAGARAVLATLWDVDDASTRAVLLDFHRALRAGEPPAAALQRAQLARLSSGQPADRQIDHWAPFVLIGASDKGTR